MQFHRHQHEIDLAHRVGGVTCVVGFRQCGGEAGRLVRLVFGRQVELDDGGEKLLNEQAHGLAVRGRADQLAAGDGVLIADR